MSEEIADSGEVGIDMDAALDTISDGLFDTQPATDHDPVVKTDKEEIVEDVSDSSEEIIEEVEKNELPASWKKDMQEKWEGVDPETQKYFLQRETQMKEGLEKDRGDANLGRTMRDVMAPYSEMLKTQNVDEPQMVKNLLGAHYRLSNSTDEEKVQLFNQLAQNYGVSLDGSQPKEVDPALKALQEQVQGMSNHLSANHEATVQAARERVIADVDKFASDPEHSYFDEISDDIVPLINAGFSLEDAYEKAIWSNPVTRQKEIDRINKENETKVLENAKQEAQKAKKAKATNVRGRDTEKTPTEPLGTMEDTMKETYRKINQN